MMMFLALASEPVLPAPTVRVRVAALRAASLIVPALSAAVSWASRSALVSPAWTV
jgi:hypothetical protein